jgi:hypothetical protein
MDTNITPVTKEITNDHLITIQDPLTSLLFSRTCNP